MVIADDKVEDDVDSWHWGGFDQTIDSPPFNWYYRILIVNPEEPGNQNDKVFYNNLTLILATWILILKCRICNSDVWYDKEDTIYMQKADVCSDIVVL